MEKEVEFWDCGDAEECLSHTSPLGAIEAHLEHFEVDETPSRITVYGFAKEKATYDAVFAVEGLVEALDEEYGDPDGDWVKVTPEMISASEKFTKEICMLYQPHVWKCDLVETREYEYQHGDWVRVWPKK